MNKIRRQGGFTVVELTVVVLLLGILVALTAVGYRSTQDKARAASVMTAARSVESAIYTAAHNLNREAWPQATDFQGGAVADILAFTNPEYVPASDEQLIAAIRRQLPQGVPLVNGYEDIGWAYRNDGSVRSTSTCDQAYTGAMLVLTGVPQRIFEKLDSEFDDSNALCGKARFTASGEILYQLGFSQEMQH